MRIDSVYIEEFKNLTQFTIDLDESVMNTVLLGQNATGKSNFIEALILIFKHLDLGSNPPFEYRIKYECRGIDIAITFKNGKYNIQTDGHIDLFDDEHYTSISLATLQKNKHIYLPKYVFSYYSGISNRLHEHFEDHQKQFYDKVKKVGVTKEDVEDLRRLFYVRLVHSHFVLLSFYTFENEESKTFLKKYLQIEDIESVLFKFQRPEWQKKNRFQEKFMWDSKGLVREFLDKLWELSLAPIDNEEPFKESFRDSAGKKREYLYLYISTKERLQKLASYYEGNTDLFKALESTYISDLIAEVKVNVKKRNVDGSITFRELSEGEQQLLTVLGLLKFTKDKETLVLLDEPDTHLNPLWKWEYLELLKNVVKKDPLTDKEDPSTQVIINTHDPLVIGSITKNQVRVFRRNDDNGKITAEEPIINPRGLGVAGILTSELFGLPTTLDVNTQNLLDERNRLLYKESEGELARGEENRLKDLFEILNQLGFTQTFKDPLYSEFIKAYEKNIAEQKDRLDIPNTQEKHSKAYELVKKIMKGK